MSQSRVLHSLVENCFCKALQVNFKKPLSYASYTSYTSYFAICKREAQCLAMRLVSREARRFGMGLCAPCRGAPTVVLRFSCQRSSVACRTCFNTWRQRGFPASSSDLHAKGQVAFMPSVCPRRFLISAIRHFLASICSWICRFCFGIDSSDGFRT